MSKSNLLRADIVGAGFIGKVHAQAIAVASGIRLTGVCGRDRERTKAFAKAHGAETYDSLSSLLSIH